jgi:hypothetical protein
MDNTNHPSDDDLWSHHATEFTITGYIWFLSKRAECSARGISTPQLDKVIDVWERENAFEASAFNAIVDELYPETPTIMYAIPDSMLVQIFMTKVREGYKY